MTSELSTTIVN